MIERFATLLRRWWIARRFGVRFHGMSKSSLPQAIRFGANLRPMRIPGDPLFVADFANVVLDDDYGLRRLDPPPRTIVDIGSNIGMFSAYARGLFPEATIHAYEPSPHTAQLNLFNAADPRTTLFVEGVAASAGRARMVELGASTLARTEMSDDGEIVLTPDNSRGNRGPGVFVEIKDGTFRTPTQRGHWGGAYLATVTGYKGRDALFSSYEMQIDLPEGDTTYDLVVPDTAE